jgi:hypothetical protein
VGLAAFLERGDQHPQDGPSGDLVALAEGDVDRERTAGAFADDRHRLADAAVADCGDQVGGGADGGAVERGDDIVDRKHPCRRSLGGHIVDQRPPAVSDGEGAASGSHVVGTVGDERCRNRRNRGDPITARGARADRECQHHHDHRQRAADSG